EPYEVTVEAPPVFTSPGTITTTVGSTVTDEVTTVDGYPTPTLSEPGKLPAGLTFVDNGDGTATIAGVATAAGTSQVTVSASSPLGPVTQTVTFKVDSAPVVVVVGSSPAPAPSPGPFPSPNPTSNPNPNPAPSQAAPTITSSATAVFVEGRPGSFRLGVSGDPAPTLSESGALPPGVRLSSGGLLSGTPTRVGKWTLVVGATNGVGHEAVQRFTLVVVRFKDADVVFGKLTGSARWTFRVQVPTTPTTGVHERSSGKTLDALTADFDFDTARGIGRMYLVLRRDVRTEKVRESVHGHVRVVAKEVAYYGGLLALLDPARAGELAFRSFAGVAMHGKTATGVAIGELKLAKRVKVVLDVHGHKHLVWRTHVVEEPIRFGFSVAPSVS
ncbi:MAG: hypothetical protein ACYCTE_17550, partial [Acidimicrobiales bacterium]